MTTLQKQQQRAREEFDNLEFATCPTEEKEPFFWKWSEHGKDILFCFIDSIIKDSYQRGSKQNEVVCINSSKDVNKQIEHRLTYLLPTGLTPSERLAIFSKVALMIEEENQAWLNCERCFNCGKEKEGLSTSDMCDKCWEEA